MCHLRESARYARCGSLWQVGECYESRFDHEMFEDLYVRKSTKQSAGPRQNLLSALIP